MTKTNDFSQDEWMKKAEEASRPETKAVLVNKDGRSDAKKTILLIDDDSFLLDMYGIKFEKAGFNVYTITTANGDIVQKVADIKPDVITLDIIMPARDGLEALPILKADERTKDIPVVMLTNQVDNQEEAFAMGAIGYIIPAKTIPAEVVEQVQKLIS